MNHEKGPAPRQAAVATKHRHVLLVLTNSMPGQSDEFNRWYDETHLSDVLAVPGIVSARRFRIAPEQMRGRRERPYEYLAIYEIESDDPKAVADEIAARGASGSIVISPALDLRKSLVQLFTPLEGEGPSRSERQPGHSDGLVVDG
jgi:hypothetical protein